MLRKPSPGASLHLAEKPVVLVVEEDAPLRLKTAKRLRAAGFDVFEAADSEKAELVLKDSPVDALFLSVRRW